MDIRNTNDPTRDTQANSDKNETEKLRDLAERLLEVTDQQRGLTGKSQTPNSQARLIVGSIPSQLPVELPVPEASRIIGTLILGQSITAVLDVAMTTADAISFYRDRLGKIGWTQFSPIPPTSHGFATPRPGIDNPEPELAVAIFCKSTKDPSLRIIADIRNDGLTQIKLTLDFDPAHSPCSIPPMPEPKSLSEVLPCLLLPLHAIARRGTHGGSATYQHSELTLITSIDAASIHDHYAKQLTQAKWLLQDQGQANGAVWSNWQIINKDGDVWQGQLLIVSRPRSKRKFGVYLQAELASTVPDNEELSDGRYSTNSSMSTFKLN